MTASLGPYLLEGELGRGGMGRVFRGRHRESSVVRAIKAIEQTDPETIVRFRREVEALARVDGGVVRVHDSGVAGRMLWFAMDLLPGGTLRDRLREGPLPWRDAVALALALARTLARCHALGLVHRDLKPENVLFDERGRPCVADFGCVRVEDASRLTETGTALGTLGYMAPEQLAGAPVDARADVFALGAILHELISGRRPFAGTTLVEVGRAMKNRERVKLRATNARVPEALDRLLDRALAPRPDERPDAGALAAELDAALANRAAGGLSSRGRAVAALVVALLVCGGALAGLRASRPVESGGPVKRELAQLTDAEVDAAVSAAPAQADLRRERLLRAARARRPLGADDVVLAAPELTTEQCETAVTRALELGLTGEGRLAAAAALHARLARSSQAAALHGIVLLEEGRRDEAAPLLASAAKTVHLAAVLDRALREVDDLVGAFARLRLLDAQNLLLVAKHVAPALQSAARPPTTARMLSAVIAPITSLLRRSAVERRLDQRIRGPWFEAIEVVLEPIQEQLDPVDFATYETATYDRRPGVDTADGRARVELSLKRRVCERLDAVLPRLLASDPALGVEAGLVLVDYEGQFDPKNVRAFSARTIARIEPHARPAQRARLAAQQCNIAFIDYDAATREDRSRHLDRVLAIAERAEPFAREADPDVRAVIAFARARVFLHRQRPLDAKRAIEGTQATECRDLRAEILRRAGDVDEAIRIAEDAIAYPYGNVSSSWAHATLAMSFAQLGRAADAQRELGLALENDDGTRFFHDLRPDDVKAIVARGSSGGR